MSVRKRHDKWWVDFRFNRRRYRKPSPDNTRAGAQAYETHLRYKLARGEPIEREEKENISFKDFTTNWFETYVKNNNKHSEVISKEMILRVHLLPYFGHRNIRDIGNLDIERYKARKLEEGLCAKTINNHLAVLSTSCKCAVEWGALNACPLIKRLKIPPFRYDFLTAGECRQLIGAAEGMWAEMIKVAIGTGLRFGELAALSWEDIDFDSNVLTVRRAFAKGVLGSPKSNQIRYVPLSASVREVLQNMQKTKGHIFPDTNGGPLRQVAAIKKLYQICRKAGIRRIGWHVLRHTFASHLAQAGASLVAIQGLLGHSDIRTTMRYAHINEVALRDAIGILDKSRNTEDRERFGHNMVTIPTFATTSGNTSRR